MALNKEQQQLVTDNHNLIYTVINSKNLNIDDENDWYGIAAIGMCKAAQTFDEKKKIKFSTYACHCMLNEIKMQLRRNNNTKNKDNDRHISLNLQLFADSNKSELGETISNCGNDFEALEVKETFLKLYEALSTLHKKIIKLLYEEDLQQIEIANLLGISKMTVTRVKTSFYEKLHNQLNADY